MFLTALNLAGCNSVIKDAGPKASNTILVDSPGQGCMGQALPKIQNYFNGAASAGDVNQASNCILDALENFDKRVHGANPSYFSAEELRIFLQDYFAAPGSRFRISDGMMRETMRLKQVVLGGEMDRITRREIKQIRVVLQTVRDEMIKLNPHIRIGLLLLAQDDPGIQKANVEAAIAQFESSFEVLSGLLNKAHSPYTIDNTVAFLTEVARLYDSNTGWQGPQWLADHISTFKAVKSFFLKAPGETVSPEEWPALILTASRLHGLWLRYHYLLDPYSAQTTGPGLASLIDTFNQLLDIVQIGVESKTDKVIEFQQIDDLINEIYHLNMIDTNHLPMQPSTMVDLMRPIVQKIYNPRVQGVRPESKGITLSTVQMMRDDFMNWAEMQQVYDGMVAGLSAHQQSHLNLPQARKLWKNVTQAKHMDAVRDIGSLLDRHYPLSYNGRIIYFDRNLANLPMNQETFTSLNWKRFFILVALRGYASDGGNSRELGWDVDQFHEFYNDLHQLAIELKILDPREPEVWKSIFQEIHIFFFSSDGKKHITYHEGVDLISFALSGGRISQIAYRDMRARCRNLQPDVFGLPMLDVKCYRKEFHQRFAEYFKYLPGVSKIAGSMDEPTWNEFLIALESSARVHGFSQQPMESADIDKMAAMFQYVESLFLRFDTDNSGTLSLEESMQIYPLLRDVLIQVSGLTEEDDLVALFTYILNYGEPPSKESLLSMGSFWVWKHQLFSSWHYEVDRAQIIKILAQISKTSETQQ